MQYGIIVNKKTADKVEKGETLAYIHANNEEKANQAAKDILKAYKITENKVDKLHHILGIL